MAWHMLSAILTTFNPHTNHMENSFNPHFTNEELR